MPEITAEFTSEDITTFLDSERGQEFVDPYRVKATEELSANNRKLVSEKGLTSKKLKDVETKYADLKANPETVTINEAVDEAALQLRIDSVVSGLNTTHTGEIDALTARLSATNKKLVSGDVSLLINAEVMRQGGSAGSVRVLTPHLLSSIKSGFNAETGEISHDVIDNFGEVKYVGGKKADIASLVSSLKADDDFKYAFRGTKTPGSGHDTNGQGDKTNVDRWGFPIKTKG